jgi:hypothetical protein
MIASSLDTTIPEPIALLCLRVVRNIIDTLGVAASSRTEKQDD